MAYIVVVIFSVASSAWLNDFFPFLYLAALISSLYALLLFRQATLPEIFPFSFPCGASHGDEKFVESKPPTSSVAYFCSISYAGWFVYPLYHLRRVRHRSPVPHLGTCSTQCLKKQQQPPAIPIQYVWRINSIVVAWSSCVSSCVAVIPDRGIDGCVGAQRSVVGYQPGSSSSSDERERQRLWADL